MSFGREFLVGIGLNEEKIAAIMGYEEKANAYHSMLIECGVNPNTAHLIVNRCKPAAINEVVIDGGKVINPEAVKASICSEWADCIEKKITVEYRR